MTYRDSFPHSYRLLPMLGLPATSPIPAGFALGPTLVNGLIYRVRTRPINGRRFHRVQVACPCCAKWIPAGRLHQHLMAHGRKAPSSVGVVG
jgi:hypothetical protein